MTALITLPLPAGTKIETKRSGDGLSEDTSNPLNTSARANLGYYPPAEAAHAAKQQQALKPAKENIFILSAQARPSYFELSELEIHQADGLPPPENGSGRLNPADMLTHEGQPTHGFIVRINGPASIAQSERITFRFTQETEGRGGKFDLALDRFASVSREIEILDGHSLLFVVGGGAICQVTSIAPDREQEIIDAYPKSMFEAK